MADPSRVLLTAFLAASLHGPAFPPAAAREEPTPLPLIEREEVRFVTLDIIAEELAGGWRPLRDLTADRIEIRVGGRPVQVDQFEDHCHPLSSLELPPGGASARPDPSGADAGSAVRDDRAGVRYILYFDTEHLDLAGRDAAFKSAALWAKRRFDPEDEVMIITAGRGLRILRPFLPATDDLQDDLDAAQQDFRAGELWATFESVRMNELMYEKNRSARRMLASSYAAIDRSKTRNSLSNLRDVMTIFDSVQGTKNLILFADTIRLLPGMQYGTTSHLTDVSTDLEGVAAAANERNVRIYPVKAGLPLVLPGSDPRLTHADSAFTLLASETGGRVFEGSNEVDGVFKLVEDDLACFYRAGFRIRPSYSGRVEPIQVHLPDRPTRVRLRYRQTLEDPTREALNAAMIRAAFMAPSTARAFPIAVRAATLFRQEEGERIQVEVATPLASLLGLPTPQGKAGSRQVRVEIGARVVPLRPLEPGARGDPSGRGQWADVATDLPSSGFGRQAVLTLPPAPASRHAADRVVATAEFDAPPGRYRIVAVIQDQLARDVAAAVTDIEVAAGSRGIGPISLASEDRAAVLVDADPASAPDGADSSWSGKELAAAAPLLPQGALLSGTSIVEDGGPLHLIYSVCLRTPERRGAKGRESGAFTATWQLERILTCGPADRSTRLPPRSLPAERVDRLCVPVLDSISADALSPGKCRFDVLLSDPGGSEERAVREFTIVPQAGREVARSSA